VKTTSGRLVYGTAAERPPDANGRVWFHLEGNTRLALEEAAAGQAPAIAHYAIKVSAFDRGALEMRLRELGTRTLPSADEPDVVRFADNNGIVVEARMVQRAAAAGVRCRARRCRHRSAPPAHQPC
jgi:hypothetical protein